MRLFLAGSPAIPTNFDVPLHSNMVPCGTHCVRLFDSRLGLGKGIKGGRPVEEKTCMVSRPRALGCCVPHVLHHAWPHTDKVS